MTADKRAKLASVFRDTQAYYQTTPALAEAVQRSKASTRLYEGGEAPDFPVAAGKAGKIAITKSRSFEAAMRLARRYPDKRIAVLNFASATNPGGGVVNGSSAQEESLCRCSTLYPTLDSAFLWQRYYNVNRTAGNVLHTDACIYSPDIIICKSDTNIPERLPPEAWCTVDVISCAAPNLRNRPANLYNPENGEAVSISPDDLQHLHEQRARAILQVAAAHQVDILVLGAFGCGAFRNDPAVVAKAYANVLKECRGYFDFVEFAIFCREYETENYDAFLAAMGAMKFGVLSKEMDRADPVGSEVW